MKELAGAADVPPLLAEVSEQALTPGGVASFQLCELTKMPEVVGSRPSRIDARDGAQAGTAAKAFSNIAPPSFRRSKFGVWTFCVGE